MIIELMRQKFRGVLRLSRQWPSSIITPMATNVPDGYYLGKNGKLYKSKRPSLIQRMEEDPDQTKVDLLGSVPSLHNSAIFGDGFEEIPAPSKTPAGKPPRAYYCGYHREAELLVIEFRPPGRITKGVWAADSGKPSPWIFYTGIDEDTWDSLKMAHSTGDWLRSELSGYAWSDVPGNNQKGLNEVVASILAS
jgi:hypothetical protein